MNKKIAMIAYTILSLDSRVIREAKAAVEGGYQVDFYTLNETAKDKIAGVNIIYSRQWQYKGKNKFKFILSYLRFFLFCFFKLSAKSFSKDRYDIAHVNNMPNFLIFSTLIAKLFGTKIIMDVHDVMPELFAQKFNKRIDSLLIKLLYLEERYSLRFADHIISVNSMCTARFKENKVRNKTYTEILNAADEEVFLPVLKKEFEKKSLKIIYPATLAIKRNGIDFLLNVMEKIKSLKKYKIKLSIFGGGEDAALLASMIKERNLEEYVYFSGGFVNYEVLNAELDKSTVGIIPFPRGYSTDFQLPVKMHEYFIKKLPVLAADVKLIRNDFKDIVLLFEAENVDDCVDKLIKLYNNIDMLNEYSEKGYEYYVNNTWTMYKEMYIKLLDSL
ncbi:MAG: glycosyltransferase family 4 protein [Candidatus Delongbacteria bacterium]|jgi:glycosyltransferase involved in cell wall biosynthesis|nr:glycosyltransferase family 4 protein [Candidatus Delongbacteria bacterium]